MPIFRTKITKSQTAPDATGFTADTVATNAEDGNWSQDNNYLFKAVSYLSGEDTLYRLYLYDMNAHQTISLQEGVAKPFSDLSLSNFSFNGSTFYYATYVRAGAGFYRVLDEDGGVVVAETKIGKMSDINAVSFDADGSLIVEAGSGSFFRIDPSNNAPVAVKDTVTMDWESKTALDVLANDTDADQDVLTITAATVKSGDATVAIKNGKLVVTYTGDDLDNNDSVNVKINYSITDGMASDTTTVNLLFAGNETKIEGKQTAETLFGTSARNIINGNGGSDIIYGGGGNDTINGGYGLDQIYGGKGKDVMSGSFDPDTYIFNALNELSTDISKTDVLADFSKVDYIDLKNLDANEKVAGDQAFKFIGTDDFGKKAGELRFERLDGYYGVFGDNDGNGKADFAIRLNCNFVITEGDFIL
ncbi:Ig-like domain-containing protein [Rhizobium alvei]|uniref:Ig-like domain-containing protein n=1 Tax=Rhizobium alvei TaxID=1132659 RepID=A0ABT8YHL7_9HYPH|nr:Ig-like domain-containing protein [Rhizobium alvei]MDO6963178.1 Ig-like domain-containing protein [Rhizobium alvei]